MPDQIADACGGDVATLFQQQGQEKPGTPVPGSRQPTSGVAGLSCPAVCTLPDAPPATAFISGANARNQNDGCPVPPAQAAPVRAAQATSAPVLSATTPAALVANCRDIDDVAKVLEGLSGPNQQRDAADVVNLALRRFGDVDHVRDLIEAVRNNDSLHQLVAEQVLHRAAELEKESTPGDRSSPRGPHRLACAYVLAALTYLRGQELGKLVAQKLSSAEGELLAATLDVKHPSGLNGILSPVRDQLLTALNSVPRTETTGAVVKKLYLQLLPEDTIIYCRPLAVSLATALAREFHPHDAVATAAEKERLQAFLERPEGAALMLTGTEEKRQRVLGVLQKYNFTVATFEQCRGPWVIEPTFAHALAEGLVAANAPGRAALVDRGGKILATEQGQEIRFGWYGFDEKIDPSVRTEAMQVIIDKGFTAEVLQQTNDPWENPVLVEAIAAKRMAHDKIYADAPIKFKSREQLISFVAFTSRVPPDHPMVKPIVDQLFSQGGSEPFVSFRPVFFSSRTTGVVQFPLYRADVAYSFGQNRLGQDRFLSDHFFVDDMGRAYKTEGHTSAFANWQGTNKLPSGVVISPKGGHISHDETGAPVLEWKDTPEKSGKGEKAVTAAMMVGGVFAGGLTFLGAGGWFVSAMGGASAIYGADSAIAGLDNRHAHGETNSFSNPEARALELNLAASVAGLGMFGVGPALNETLYAGRLTHEMALLTSTGTAVAVATDAAASVNGIAYLIANYKRMKGDDIGVALLQMGWQAVMSGVGIAQAGGLRAVVNPMDGARMLIAQHLPPPRVNYNSTTVAGNAVEVRLVDGHHYEVFAGPQANEERTAHHVKVVRQLEGDITFGDMLGRWAGGRSNTEMATAAADIRKLNSWIAQQTLKLESPALAPGERKVILDDIAVCKQHRDELTERLGELRNRPDADRGGQPIQLPDSTGPGSDRTASASEQFINWLGNEHPRILRDVKEGFRRRGSPIGSNADFAADTIVAGIVKSKKGWLGTAKYGVIYEKYLELIAARVQERDQLRSSPAAQQSKDGTFGAAKIGKRPPEWDFVDWLVTRHRDAINEARSALGSFDVDKIVRWLVQSKKYRLGVNPQYNDIFGKYIELNNRRSQEIRNLESSSPVETTRWVIDPMTGSPVLFEPGTPAQGEGDTVHPADPPDLTLLDTHPPKIPDVGGRVVVVVSVEKTASLVQNLFTCLKGIPNAKAKLFIERLIAQIDPTQGGTITVEGFLKAIERCGRQTFDPAKVAQIKTAMGQLISNDPNVVSSDRLRFDNQLDRHSLLMSLR